MRANANCIRCYIRIQSSLDVDHVPLACEWAWCTPLSPSHNNERVPFCSTDVIERNDCSIFELIIFSMKSLTSLATFWVPCMWHGVQSETANESLSHVKTKIAELKALVNHGIQDICQANHGNTECLQIWSKKHPYLNLPNPEQPGPEREIYAFFQSEQQKQEQTNVKVDCNNGELKAALIHSDNSSYNSDAVAAISHVMTAFFDKNWDWIDFAALEKDEYELWQSGELVVQDIYDVIVVVVDTDYNLFLIEDPSAWMVATDDVDLASFAAYLGATTVLSDSFSGQVGHQVLQQLLLTICRTTPTLERDLRHQPKESINDPRVISRKRNNPIGAAREAEQLFPLDSRHLYSPTVFQQCTLGHDVSFFSILDYTFPGQCSFPLLLGTKVLTDYTEFVSNLLGSSPSETVRFWLTLGEVIVVVFLQTLGAVIEVLRKDPNPFFSGPLGQALVCLGDFSASQITRTTRQVDLKSADNTTIITNFKPNTVADLQLLYNVTNGGNTLFDWNPFPLFGGQYLHLKPNSTWSVFAIGATFNEGDLPCQFLASQTAVTFILGISFCSDDYLPSFVMQMNGGCIACAANQPAIQALTGGISQLFGKAVKAGLDQFGIGFSFHNAFEQQLIIYDGVSGNVSTFPLKVKRLTYCFISLLRLEFTKDGLQSITINPTFQLVTVIDLTADKLSTRLRKVFSLRAEGEMALSFIIDNDHPGNITAIDQASANMTDDIISTYQDLVTVQMTVTASILLSLDFSQLRYAQGKLSCFTKYRPC